MDTKRMTSTNSAINKNSRIFVAGHRGLVGSALLRALSAGGYRNVVVRTREQLDLRDQAAVTAFFATEGPEHVLLAAAKVGGILANDTRPAEFIDDNLLIAHNVLRSARSAGIRRLLFLGSSCVYPRDCPQPIKEEYLLSGPLEATNRSYAVAKIAGIEMCWAYNRQYGTRYLAAMPTNLYGPGDNYDLEESHVIPGLIRKMHDAKLQGTAKVILWGTGSPLREFLYCDDLAEACIVLMQADDVVFDSLLRDSKIPPLVNIGCGKDLTIRELARLIAQVVGYPGEVVFDTTRPDGTPRKLLDVSKMKALGWAPKTELHAGLKLTYQKFLDNQAALPTTSSSSLCGRLLPPSTTCELP
jgi:GDP-L-fucose synthase